jgi:hypothetical protein
MDFEEIFNYSSCLISIHQLPPASAGGIKLCLFLMALAKITYFGLKPIL